MQRRIKQGLNAGLTFGVVIVFLIMIGFTVTAVELISGIFGEALTLAEGAPVPAEAMYLLMLLYALLGIWAGISSAKPLDNVDDSYGYAVLGGIVAGAVTGVFTAVLTILVGSLQANEVDMRAYFVALGPRAVSLITYALSPVSGGLQSLGLLTASGLIGGLIARGFRGSWRDTVGQQISSTRDAIANTAVATRLRRSKYTDWIIYGLILAFLIWLPTQLTQFWNYNLGTVGIYVLLGLGLNIVVGMAGLLDLGYVAFFAIGAYTVALLTAPAPHNLQWSFWVALPIGIVLAALAGILLGIPVLRLRGDYLAIVTLGFGEIIRILSKSDVLTGFSGGPRGVRDIAGPTLFGRPFNSEIQFVYLIIIGCLLVIFVTSRLQNSRVGRAWIAMREDETVAQAMGINTWQYKLMAFAMGAAFAGLGGVLFASRNQFTGPEDHNLLVSINVLSLVIVGGMGSIPGVIVGALALKGLPEVLRQVESFRLLAFGGLLVAMMILRPEGLWPSRRRRMELETPDVEDLPPEPDPLSPHEGGEPT